MNGNPNDRQVGGDHYKGGAGGLDHWDVVELNGVGYLEACATKYVQRRKDPKARVQDLEKAKHYSEKALQLYNDDLRRPRGCVPVRIIKRWVNQFKLSELEFLVIRLLFNWRQPSEMHAALAGIDDLIALERVKLENAIQKGSATA